MTFSLGTEGTRIAVALTAQASRSQDKTCPIMGTPAHVVWTRVRGGILADAPYIYCRQEFVACKVLLHVNTLQPGPVPTSSTRAPVHKTQNHFNKTGLACFRFYCGTVHSPYYCNSQYNFSKIDRKPSIEWTVFTFPCCFVGFFACVLCCTTGAHPPPRRA